MYREKRPAKYLEDLNVYTKRQIKILYFNGYGRDPTDKELKDLLAKADAQDDFENIQFILNNYNCDRIDDNEDDDTTTVRVNRLHRKKKLMRFSMKSELPA